MSKITNKQIARKFARKDIETGKRRIFMSDTYLQHQMVVSMAPLVYRAPHANRPTAPRHKYV